VLKWTFSIVLFGLLLLCAIYIIHVFTKNKIQLESNAIPKVLNILYIVYVIYFFNNKINLNDQHFFLKHRSNLYLITY